jgi:hypothetical protein
MIDMKVSLLLLISFILVFGCSRNKFQEEQTPAVLVTGSFSGSLIADTIIYDVIIHNTNPDDQWTQQCLQYVNQRMFIDSLFKLVYEEKVIAFDFFEKKPLRIKDVRKLESEAGFNRDNIGKIQFTERWYFDSSKLQFQKEVISIVLGYDLYDNDGSIRGHKPVFKINLNH